MVNPPSTPVPMKSCRLRNRPSSGPRRESLEQETKRQIARNVDRDNDPGDATEGWYDEVQSLPDGDAEGFADFQVAVEGQLVLVLECVAGDPRRPRNLPPS